MNIAKAAEILEKLASVGTTTLCLCPGARNAPFVMLLAKSQGFEVISFFDERSAGFFALGRARRDSRPVAILTTSGTAASELLSPMIEAFHSDQPLIALTSDRPKRLRGTGAPQTIDQSQIFNGFVEKSWDISVVDDFDFTWSFKKPVHVNICFDEPLIDGAIQETIFRAPANSAPTIQHKPFQLECPKPLVVVGALRSEQRPFVIRFLQQQNVPVFAESLSGLRDVAQLEPVLLRSGEKMAGLLLKSVQSVLRIGDIPVGKYWRDLDRLQVPIYNLTDKDFSGLENSETVLCDLMSDLEQKVRLQSWDWQEIRSVDQRTRESILQLIAQFPQSEMALIANMSRAIAPQESIYLGNSLPVRIWDLVDTDHGQVFASRGVNGIDGQLSTGIGLVDFRQKMWILLGDLTTLYDFSGFWLTEYLQRHEASVNLVVVNNGGGQIFSRMFSEKLFINSHRLEFRKLAEMWNWKYQKITSAEQLTKTDGLNLIEIAPDPRETEQFWKHYDLLWQK